MWDWELLGGLSITEEHAVYSQCSTLNFLEGDWDWILCPFTCHIRDCQPSPLLPHLYPIPKPLVDFFFFFKRLFCYYCKLRGTSEVLHVLEYPILHIQHIQFSGRVELGSLNIFFLFFPRLCSSLRQVPIRPWPKSVWPKAAA